MLTLADVTALADPQVGPFAAVSVEGLVTDLRGLLRGPGAQRGQVMARIGPTLRTMCGIAVSDTSADAIEAAASWLRDRIALLPGELGMCALLAFGLHERTRVPGPRARLAEVARFLDRSEPTARRWVDAAINKIATMTTPDESLPRRLRSHAGRWIDLTAAIPTAGGHIEMSDRCYLVAAAQLIYELDKVYALVRLDAHASTVLAIPAVHVRHVALAPHR